MTIHSSALRALPALTLLGCVSDFSPDPFKGPQNIAMTPDGGASVADAGRTWSSATITTPGPTASTDAGSSVAPTGTEVAARPVAPTGSGPCDLSGRWLVTERAQSSAYGAQQVSLTWHYMEISQQGDALTVAKSLVCGGSTNSAPGEVFEVHMDDRRAWPGYQAHTNYDGRKGSSRPNGTGCDVAFERGGLIRGMTVDYYKDSSHGLPTVDQQENGATPGWADWDNDGNPGVTMVVTGVASGSIYTALRVTITSTSGHVEQNAQNMRLDDYNWKQERVVLGTKEPDPLGILSSPAERNPGAGLNFVEFGRLAAAEATGSDDAICAAVRMLAHSINPAANAK